MIGSLMYLTAFRPDIMFAVCPKLGLWYPKVSSIDLEAYSDSDYAGANLNRKSTTGGYQFLGKRLISWQCKKQTIVATSTIEAEYVAAASCCGQVLWIQNQMLDYGFNFMNTKIYIDNESTICIVKNPVYHSKTKHIAIRHHFIRDAYEKKLIQALKIHIDVNVADLLTKEFDYRQSKVSTDKEKVSTNTPDGVNEEMENADAEVSTEDVLSTAQEKVSTDTPKVSTNRSKVSTDKEKVSTDTPKVSTDGSKVSTDKEKDSIERTDEGTDDQTKGRRATQTIQTTQTPTSTMFGDDETIAQNESVKEEGKEEEGTKKRKSGYIKMIARKKPRKQSDDDSDDEHRKCLKIVTFETTIDNLKSKTFEEIQALYEKVKRFDESFTAVGSTEDERRIKEMSEGVKDTDQKRLKEEDTAKVPAKVEVIEQGTNKRKGGHIKMIARKKPRKHSDVDNDDEHRKCLRIVAFEGTIDSEIMEKKSFIARLNKVSSPDGDYLVIYRANGNFRAFNYLMEVLHIFYRQDLYHLYNLKMEQYSETTLERIELILWGDLKIMIESSTKENDQKFKDGTVIYMLVERRYPLSKELLQRMLDLGLEVERESTVAFDLIRVFNSPCFMVKSWLVQDQTVLGKDYSNLLIADSLLKTIWFINAPCYGNEALASPKANELTIPEQTATGKGTSNPFMAGSLPKTTKPT
ncbi:hypothetical protein Tco_0573410 [Tanacetum coccineum]